MSRRIAVAAFTVTLVPLAACALAGCGNSGSATTSSSQAAAGAAPAGSNAGLTQARLLARLQDALGGASAMHMKGSIDDDGSTLSVDMQLNRNGTAQGTMIAAGTRLPVIAIGGVTYMQITADKAASAPAPSGAKPGDWVAQPGESGDSMTDYAAMVQELDAPSKYSYTYRGTSTIAGHAVAQYEENAIGGGVDKLLSIPLTGPALPVSVDGGAQGAFTFTWDQPTKVVAPPSAEVFTSPGT